MLLRASAADESKRLDSFITEKTGLSRSQARKLIDSGLALLNGKPPPKAGERLRPDDSVEITVPEPAREGLVPEPIPLKVVFEDEHLIVVDKPADMVVYPATGHNRGTLMNAVAYHSKRLASIGAPLRAGVVHRLDKDTTGLMVIALTDNAYYGLARQFKDRSIKRSYAVIVHGEPKENEGTIELKIGRSESNRKKMSTKVRRGREALTRWKVIERFGVAALVQAVLGTGRTHQIRVHFASTGHPVLGDRTYGRKTDVEVKGNKIHIPRQMLHARELGFVHPETGGGLHFESPMPPDMKGLLEKLRELKMKA
ncbi:MAG: RluA family pseudouridine synthase [Nitrospiraceae bacterium]|nr:RluA family pseudouridine synthase [Nitrospiraceae bacterium]